MIKPPTPGTVGAPSNTGDSNSAMPIPMAMPGGPAAFAAANRLPFMPGVDPRLAFMSRMNAAAAAAALAASQQQQQQPGGGGGADRAEMMRILAAYGAAPPAAMYPMCMTPRAYMEQLMAARQAAAATAAVAAAAQAAGASRMYAAPGMDAYAAAATHPFLRDPTAGLAYYQQRAAIAAAAAAAAAASNGVGGGSSPSQQVQLKLAPTDFKRRELEQFHHQGGGDTRQPVEPQAGPGGVVVKDHSQPQPEGKSAAEEDSKLLKKGPSPVPAAKPPTKPPTDNAQPPLVLRQCVDASGLEALSRIARMRSHAPLYSPRGAAPACANASAMAAVAAPPQPSPSSPRGSSFMHAMGEAEGSGGQQEEDAAAAPLGRRRERWTPEEHERFLDGLNKYGRKWTKIQTLLPHKTASQIRVHAYSFFSKLMQDNSSANGLGFMHSPDASPTAAGSLAAAQREPPQPPSAFSSVYSPQPVLEREGSEDGADLLEVAEIISTLRKSREVEGEEVGRKRRPEEIMEEREAQKRSHVMSSLVRHERQ